MCEHTTNSADPSDDSHPDDTYLIEPESLTIQQIVGDACAVCHAKWPRPRALLGGLPDGTVVYGCAECANIAMDYRAQHARASVAAN